MSVKKRKNISPWIFCEICNLIVAQKDAVIHKKQSCPPNFQHWDHPFISHESLYTICETFQPDEKNLDLISKENRNEFVLMPFHVLQLCKIPMGDPVLVTFYPSSNAVVKISWPLQEKISDFKMAVSAEVSELYNLEPKSYVIVSKLKNTLSTAKLLTVHCEDDIPEKITLLARLQEQNTGKIYKVGNKLLISHYGRKAIFKIVKVISSLDEESSEFCLTTCETVWKLSGAQDEKQKGNNSIMKLGGLDLIIAELKDVISLALKKNIFLSGVLFNRGVLIHGPAGTGKTTLIEALAEFFDVNIVRIECTKIFSKFIGETEKELENLFQKAKCMSPSIILIDDLDVLCAKTNSASELERRLIATLSIQMDKLNQESTLAVVLGATSKIHQIDKMLRCPSRFGKEVEIYVPGSTQRFEILKLLLLQINHELSDSDVKNIADSSHGFVGADLVSLVSKAALRNYKSSQMKQKVSFEDFQWALGKIKPSAMKEIMIDVPNVKWDDIGGQEELKLKLKQCVEWPLKYKESFTRLGIAPPKGVLLFGPPGCSKTMIAKALATESKLNFISVKGPELFSKWVGESERAVRKVFRMARQTAPSVIFFDELDAIGGERTTSTGSNVQERVLAQLLTELDGVESLGSVTVIAATNRLDRIDPALIRPGRLDRIIYVPLPDRATRHEIFRLQLRKTCISDDVNEQELIEKTEGYSGAEIIAVCREAALKALEENLEAKRVSWKHFAAAFDIVVPRTPKSLLDLYEKYLVK